jgi:hypothetical protein
MAAESCAAKPACRSASARQVILPGCTPAAASVAIFLSISATMVV